jgi:hypothetical protein
MLKFSTLLLCVGFSAQLLALELKNPALISTLTTQSPWIVLGLVGESEKQSCITPEGDRIRKELEEAIQLAGGEVLPLSLTDRMKLERLWSLPYTGRFSEELKKSSLDIHAGVVSGSYALQNPEKIQLILLTPIEQKSLVFHETIGLTSQKLTREEEPRQEHESKSAFKWISLTENLEPSRQLPEEKSRRRSSNQMALEKRKANLKLHLDSNPVLQKYKSEIAEKSEAEKMQLCQGLINESNNSFMTSSKIELLSRAYILNQSSQTPNLEIQAQLLERLISHEDFFNDRAR